MVRVLLNLHPIYRKTAGNCMETWFYLIWFKYCLICSLGVNPAVTAIQQSGSASNSPVSGDGKQEKVRPSVHNILILICIL